MTCVAGIALDGKVTMGADSAGGGGNGWGIRAVAVPKAFRKGPMLMGYTTSFRMGQLLRHKLVLPEQESEDDLQYMVVRFVEAVRECLKAGGYSEIDNNREEGGVFLVGYKGVLYRVGDDFQVTPYKDGLAACGCGVSYALAAMHVLGGTPRERVQRALETAAYFSGGVLGPFIVLEACTAGGKEE